MIRVICKSHIRWRSKGIVIHHHIILIVIFNQKLLSTHFLVDSHCHNIIVTVLLLQVYVFLPFSRHQRLIAGSDLVSQVPLHISNFFFIIIVSGTIVVPIVIIILVILQLLQ